MAPLCKRHIFCWVRGLACTGELDSYVGGSLAAAMATQAGQVSSELPDKGT
jgi:hypothetical protein